tara:strand:- start:150 stop:980 length:831 start_codon:yes stop_codon:yes gene_type:complete
MRSIDLHLHSFYSDGSDSPTDVVRKAKSNELGLISLTDHDSIDGYFEALEECNKVGISIMPGVEITTITHHMLGYNFDINDREFRDFIRYSRSLQEDVGKKRTEKLREYGVPITIDKVKDRYPNSALSKMTLLKVMKYDLECIEYLKDQHGSSSREEIFDFYLGRKGIAHRVTTDDFISWEQSADAIHKAGGIAIAAHPSVYVKDPSEIEEQLQVVDGLEVQPRFVEQSKPFEEYAVAKCIAITYGSDHHDERYQTMLKKGDAFLDKYTLKILGLT